MNSLDRGRRGNEREALDVMAMPTVVIRPEEGAQLWSLLLKAENPDWGETETPLAHSVVRYFAKNPFASELIASVRAVQEAGIDEEALYNAALVYKHPKRRAPFLAFAAEHKSHVAEPEKKLDFLLGILEQFEEIFRQTELHSVLQRFIAEDVQERIARKGDIEERIRRVIGFFKPDPQTSNITTVVLVPTDPLYKRNSGRAFSFFPEEHIIISHRENFLNQEHEFSHGIINPIVKKLSEVLSDEQKKRISELARAGLKEDYGEGFFSLLCEEVIRTYTEVYAQRKKPYTREDFVQHIAALSDEKLQEEVDSYPHVMERFKQLGAGAPSEFREKAGEYYDAFHQKNSLRDVIFSLLKAYDQRTDTNFEHFVIEELPNRLSADV